MALSCHGALQELRTGVTLSVALAGNPNVGKSSIFNRLTGMGVATANYPGKTVEVQLAVTRLGDQRIGVIDLPGTYALGGVSDDQWVARQALLDGAPDAVILVLDATNLARNLYLGLQVLDLGIPLVVALNVVDQAEARGIRIDAERLTEILGCPVIPTVATRGDRPGYPHGRGRPSGLPSRAAPDAAPLQRRCGRGYREARASAGPPEPTAPMVCRRGRWPSSSWRGTPNSSPGSRPHRMRTTCGISARS